jgi:uncharacterized membrane protein
MPQPEHRDMTEHEAEQLIGNLLRVGVLTAAAVVLVGAVVYLFQHHSDDILTRLSQFNPESEPAELRSLSGIVRFALGGHGRGLIQLGLVLLIATPVARVALSVYLFGRLRDWLYVGVTIIVLAVLLYSLFLEH